MSVIKAIILGIIEGITEFLPISSTGHLIIANNFLSFGDKGFENAFNVIIQLGAILSVVFLYWNKLNPFSYKKVSKKLGRPIKNFPFKERAALALKNPDKRIIRLWVKIIVGVIPAAILGFLFDDFIDAHLFSTKVVAITLILYGIVIILIETKYNRETKFNSIEEAGLLTCLLVGVFQCLAMIPGTSRSAATIIGAVLLGFSRSAAAEFSFFLAIPTMLGATLLKLFKIGTALSFGQFILIFIGGLVSFIVALIVIRTFMNYIKKHNFVYFGYYRIFLGLILIILMIAGVI